MALDALHGVPREPNHVSALTPDRDCPPHLPGRRCPWSCALFLRTNNLILAERLHSTQALGMSTWAFNENEKTSQPTTIPMSVRITMTASSAGSVAHSELHGKERGRRDY